MKSIIQRDNLHMSWRAIDGFNKAINIFISPREPGKTDTTWWEKIYSQWIINHRPWCYWVRQSVEINEIAIDDIENTINKWAVNPVLFIYNKSQCKDGMLDVFIREKEGEEPKLFFRMVSLSIKIKRLKSCKIENIGGIFFDEYIINPKSKETYLPDEYMKIKESYTTLKRSYYGDGILKIYVAGNPYTLFNPLFIGLGVDIASLRKDEYVFMNGEWKLKHHIYVGHTYAIEWGVLHPLLKEKLLKENPFYQFDEEYNQYALEGMAVNDRNIKLDTLPKNFYLEFVIRTQGKNIGIFKNNYMDGLEDRYFCKFLDEVSARRTIYCFDFEEMIDRTILVSLDERMKLKRFKEAMRKRLVSFEDINVYYFMEEVFKNI